MILAKTSNISNTHTITAIARKSNHHLKTIRTITLTQIRLQKLRHILTAQNPLLKKRLHQPKIILVIHNPRNNTQNKLLQLQQLLMKKNYRTTLQRILYHTPSPQSTHNHQKQERAIEKTHSPTKPLSAKPLMEKLHKRKNTPNTKTPNRVPKKH